MSPAVVTTPFLTLLVMTGRWWDILGWAVITLAALGVITLLAARWPLPRSWLFYIGIFVATAIHVIGIEVSSVPGFDGAGLGLFLTAGVSVCSGLTAYDALRQGVVRTCAATAMVTG